VNGPPSPQDLLDASDRGEELPAGDEELAGVGSPPAFRSVGVSRGVELPVVLVAAVEGDLHGIVSLPPVETQAT